MASSLAKNDNEFMLNSFASWDYCRRVLAHAVLAIMLGDSQFEDVAAIVRLVNYRIFAYDVVKAYKDGKSQAENAMDLMVADSALSHMMGTLREWAEIHSPVESEIYFNVCSYFMMAPILITEIPELSDEECRRMLDTVLVDEKKERIGSHKILEYAWNLHDVSMSKLAEFVQTNLKTSFYEDAVDRLIPLGCFKQSIATNIKPFVYNFISKNPETYYRRKIKEMFKTLETMDREPKEDDYIAIFWYLREWTFHAARLADEKTWNLAAYILEAVIYECMKATITGARRFRTHLLENEKYREAIVETLKVADELYLSALECMDIDYVMDASDRFARLAGDFRVSFMSLVNVKVLLDHCDELISRNCDF